MGGGRTELTKQVEKKKGGKKKKDRDPTSPVMRTRTPFSCSVKKTHETHHAAAGDGHIKMYAHKQQTQKVRTHEPAGELVK